MIQTNTFRCLDGPFGILRGIRLEFQFKKLHFIPLRLFDMLKTMTNTTGSSISYGSSLFSILTAYELQAPR